MTDRGRAEFSSRPAGDDEKEIAEAVLRTRRHAFRDALPEILNAVRQAAARRERFAEERRRGADRMIADYRGIIRAAAWDE